MDNQKKYRNIANQMKSRESQLHIELDFIFKKNIFWDPIYLAHSEWLEHIPFAFWLVDALQPRKIVEIGTNDGSSYFSFCQAVANLELDTQCFSINTWSGAEHSSENYEDAYSQVSIHNKENYFSFSTLMRSIPEQALEHFEEGSIDLLHIDGLHTLDAVRQTFENWLPKLSPSAVVIMHDTNIRTRGFGVFRFFNELKAIYPHFEFAHGNGLGVIGVGNKQHTSMQALYRLSSKPSTLQQAKDIFSRLGKVCCDSRATFELQQKMDRQASEYKEALIYEQEQHALERGHITARINSQHQEIEALHAKLAEYQAQEHKFDAQQGALKTLQAEAKTNQARLEQERDLALHARRQLEINNATLSQQLAQAREQKFDAQQSALKALQADLNNQLTDAKTHQARLAQERDMALNTQHQLETKNAELSQEIEALHAKLAEYQAQEHKFDAQQGALKTLQAEAKTNQARLEQERDLALHARRQLEINNATLSQQLAQAREQKFDAQQSALKALQADLNNQLTDAKTHQARLAQERDMALNTQHQLETKNAELSQQLAQALEQLRETAHVQTQLQCERDTLVSQHKQIERELIDSRQRLHAAALLHQNELKQLQQQNSALTEHRLVLEASVAERFHELALMTRHAESLTRELESKEQQLQQARERAQRLKRSVSWKLTAPVRAIARTFKDKGEPSTNSTSTIERIANSGLFDERWYCEHYPEVAISSLSAIEHYLEIGAEQGYNPSSVFDTRWYIDTYPDVAQSAINPLIHYIMHGQAEQRHCLPTY
ncbi:MULTISPECIES: class I SAM-dependent methyltransferase [Aeromonas]|uniref:class I SAM-dependent methyltransferase n=1 Tax=Aeromonas TaxID=642 RepID=UPI001495EB6F|nr:MULTISPECIES: class I SAM-dependent methyltransferase [Aeromonas]MBA8783258.1 class I SAM-dependent methyltransferase [Aeromonas caviae]MBA8787312.1 class I SAM-dependent methyltransferase [Aeromonas sp. TW 6]